METAKKFSEEELRGMMGALENEETYGMVVRAKGIVPDGAGNWLHFDYTPGEIEVRHGTPEVTGRLCVIGSKIHEDALKTLFGV